MAFYPQYVGGSRSPSIVISTANPNRDGVTGTYGELLLPGTFGSRIDRIRVQALEATTAGMIRFFVGGGLIYELPVVANTPSGTNPAWGCDVAFDNGLVLEAAVGLKVSTHNAESFAITIINGGDF